MDRRAFVAGVVAVLAAPLVAAAPPRRAAPVVGFLGPPPSAGGLVQAFQQGLRELGYVEGRNIRVEYRFTDVALEERAALLRELAAQLVALEPDVLVASVTEAVIGARSATGTIPIVMVSVPDPVAAGLVASLAHPGGNVTGLSRETRELVGKDLQLLKDALPAAVRVGVLTGVTTNPVNAAMVADARGAARALGLQATVVEAAARSDLEPAFGRLHAARVQAVVVLGGAAFYLERGEIAALALRYRLPSVFQNREFVEAGGFLSYAPSTVANYRRAAFFVDRLLKGARAADLPVEQPTQVELVINRKTATALGLTIPPSLLARADQVIE